jgi:hypothetical protein
VLFRTDLKLLVTQTRTSNVVESASNAGFEGIFEILVNMVALGTESQDYTALTTQHAGLSGIEFDSDSFFFIDL